MSRHDEVTAPLRGRLLTPVTAFFGALVVAMAVVAGVRLVRGIGAVTNLNDGYPWGLWIAWDDVVGSALASGGFATALLVYILNRGQYHPLVRPALVAALLGNLMAGVSVMLDLGRWWDFWHIFWPPYAQVNSVLLAVSLCITAYILVVMIELIPVVAERFGWTRLRARLNKVLFVVVAIGVVLPVIQQSSLGLLLVVFGPQVHPLYQSNLLPLLFLTSTVGMGFAAVTIESGISSLGLKRPFEKELLAGLLQIGRWLMALFLLMRFGDLAWRGVLGQAFAPTLPALTFWLENALSTVPLWLLATPRQRQQAKLLFLSAMAMALAGIVYRLSAFLVAYDTGAGWHYFPSLGEITITVGLIAAEVLGIIFAVRLLPILPVHPETRTP